MESVKTVVKPGNCGMETEVHVFCDSSGTVNIQVSTRCQKINDLAAKLQGADAVLTASLPFDKNPVYTYAGKHRVHSGCPVPTALVKSLEVIAGLALPDTVTIQISAK